MTKQVQQEDWEEKFEDLTLENKATRVVDKRGHYPICKKPVDIMCGCEVAEYQTQVKSFIRKEKQLSYEQGRKEEREKAELEKWDLGRKCYECDGKGVIPPPLK